MTKSTDRDKAVEADKRELKKPKPRPAKKAEPKKESASYRSSYKYVPGGKR
jgi:hypothetical protein